MQLYLSRYNVASQVEIYVVLQVAATCCIKLNSLMLRAICCCKLPNDGNTGRLKSGAFQLSMQHFKENITRLVRQVQIHGLPLLSDIANFFGYMFIISRQSVIYQSRKNYDGQLPLMLQYITNIYSF